MNQPTPIITDIRSVDIEPSGANPRGAFTDAGIIELANSIAEQGILHNLVVRAAKGNGKYRIIAGERRHRAVGELIAAGRLPEDTALPCRVIVCDDADALALALVENLQREDLAPLDEAGGFARLRKLDAKKWSTEGIANAIGKTQRHVQLRLELVEKLTKPVQKALGDGSITLAAARTLTVVPAGEQRGFLGNLKEGFYGDARSLRTAIVGDKPAVEIAAFDLALYPGTFIADPDDADRLYFADVAHFQRLQRDAAKDKVEELAKMWSWAEFRDHRAGEYFSSFDFNKSQDKKKAGAIVELDHNGRITVHTGLVKRKRLGDEPKAKAKPEAREFTKPHLAKARRIKTRALQRAILGDPDGALRLAVLGLMGSSEVKIKTDAHGVDDRGLDPLLVQIADGFKPDFEGALGESWDGELSVRGLGFRHSDPGGVAAWKVLAAMPMTNVRKLFAALVAAQFGSWNDYDPALGDTALVCTVAQGLGADPAKVVEIDDDFLASCRKPGLLELVAALASAMEQRKVPTDHLYPARIGKKTAKALRSIILAGVGYGYLDDFVPRECRFGSKADLEVLKPAEPKPMAKESLKRAKKILDNKSKVTKKAKAKVAKKAKAKVAKKAKPRSRRGMIKT